MKLHPSIQPYREALLRLVYPASCPLCEILLEITESGLCGPCLETMQKAAYGFEDACSPQRLEFLDTAYALYPYESPAGEILSAVKFYRKHWLIPIFEDTLREFAGAIGSETGYDAVVPIPIDRRRLFEREFNQAELIAALVSKHAKIPVKKILKKTRRTFSQSGLGKEERQVNLFQAFRLSRLKAVEGKKFLLIDDVFTTGATGEEAARLLKKHRAAQVDILTVARTESRKEAAA